MKSLPRFLMHRARELALYSRSFKSGKGRLLFVPSTGKQFAGLLRSYEIADELRKRGWNCLVLPKQLEPAQRRRVAQIYHPDLVILLKSRDDQNYPHFFAGTPYIYDLDDADFVDPNLVSRIREDVTEARAVMAGSRYVANWCQEHNPNTHVVWTGSRPMEANWPAHKDRRQILTWAQSNPINYPREFDFVVSVMETIAKERQGLTLRLYGGDASQDGGRSRYLERRGVSVQWMPFMDYDAFVRSLGDTVIGFSPISIESEFSRGKSFGKILAYLTARVPVITSDEVDHSAFFTRESGVVSNDPEVWVSEALSLLASDAKRTEMAKKAHDLFMSKLSLDVTTDKIERLVQDTLTLEHS